MSATCEYGARPFIAAECDHLDLRQKAGHAEHNQGLNPPSHFVPWEHDESAEFKDLPAGGRLAYACRMFFEKPALAHYVRVRCTCRKGWSILLSEIEVFDRVTVDKNIPPPAVLPKWAATSGSGKLVPDKGRK